MGVLKEALNVFCANLEIMVLIIFFFANVRNVRCSASGYLEDTSPNPYPEFLNMASHLIGLLPLELNNPKEQLF